MEQQTATPPTRSKRADGSLSTLTKDWGAKDVVSLYLERCQVDTPLALVKTAWRHIAEHRKNIGFVVDFGAGDGRFAQHGNFDRYLGFEIDASRSGPLGLGAEIISACAFSEKIEDADLAIGNPPFVRNQDLPAGWRTKVSDILRDRTGVALSGLANAWQYFFLLALASVKPSGLCALVIPYEWVSRPSAKAIRSYIVENGWNVDVFKLVDETFDSVLTTASITIVDKAQSGARWRYFEETKSGKFKKLESPSGAPDGVLKYARRSELQDAQPRAKRGLSPGTQKVFVLTEAARVSNGLKIGRDVLPCITSLKPVPKGETVFDIAVFNQYYRHAGQRCWLIAAVQTPSRQLASYLDSVPEEQRQTKTCTERDTWWKYKIPAAPEVLISQTFKKQFPKAVKNDIGAIAVGGVCGVYNLTKDQMNQLVGGFGGVDISANVVSYAKGLHKLEINQLNWFLNERFSSKE